MNENQVICFAVIGIVAVAYLFVFKLLPLTEVKR